MRKDSHYSIKFQESHSLSDLFNYISHYAWLNLEQSFEHQCATIGEEDITKTLVREILFALSKPKVRVPIRFFLAKK
jgi:hypothetical protein